MNSTQMVHKASPIVKWAGGKGQLLPQLEPLFPVKFTGYFEPFLGGGAVFFHLQPPRVVISDINQELINAHIVVRDSVEELIANLSRHVYDKEYYYEVRAQDPVTMSSVERAARLIFLNRTCFNGLYRVNQKGKFNVPFGRYDNPIICDAGKLRATHEALQGAEILAEDFGAVLQLAGKQDFLYLDPPYHPLNETANFTNYTQGGFGEDDQRRLAKVLANLDSLGCRWLLSNSDTPLIWELYRGLNIKRLEARRAINSKVEKRGVIGELAIRNYL